MRFLPSLTMSLLLNVAFFGALHPIEGTRGQKTEARYRVQRLRRIAVKPQTMPLPEATAAPEVTLPQPRPKRSVTRKSAERATAPTQPTAKPSRKNRGGGDGRPVSRAGGAPTSPVARAMGSTGGDGTRRTPARPNAGGGDPITATPIEPGSPTAPRETVALGGIDTRAPLGSPDNTRDAPVRLQPVPGLHGGTTTAPTLGIDPLPGTAGSGSNPDGVAPASLRGFDAPLVPTTLGPQIRTKPGPGLPGYIEGTVAIPATTIVARGNSGGGGGTALTPGRGGGGPPAIAGMDRSGDGGGGSGMITPALKPGGTRIGTGPGGGGGGGNGLGTIGDGILGTPDGTSPHPASTGGAPSIIANPGHGVPGAKPVRPGERAAGPGGGPSMAKAPDAKPGKSAGPGGPGGPGTSGPGGRGPGQGPGKGGGSGGGSYATAVSRGDDGTSGYTALVIDSLALKWHHYPTSFDLHIGSVNGPRLATIGIYRYPSVNSAKASSRATRNGRRDALVIRPSKIEYIVRDGEGARQRVVISSSDAQKIKDSGLLKERDRILTVWKDNVQ